MKKLSCFWRKAEILRLLQIHAAALFAAALYYFALLLFGITCPIKFVTGRPCPTCGMTRAIFALLCGDGAGYFAANPLALPVLAAVWALIHLKNKSLKSIAVAALAANFIFYVLR